MTHSPFLLPHECGGGKGGLRIERHVLVEVRAMLDGGKLPDKRTHHFSPRPSIYDDRSENWEGTAGDGEWPNGQVVFPGRNGAKGNTQTQERRTQVLMLCRCGVSPAGRSRHSQDLRAVSRCWDRKASSQHKRNYSPAPRRRIKPRLLRCSQLHSSNPRISISRCSRYSNKGIRTKVGAARIENTRAPAEAKEAAMPGDEGGSR